MSAGVKSASARRPRGRPRNLAARAAILRAARELLAEGGPAALTMEGVAARAGVGKPTVYRWWPDRHAVAMAALMDGETRPRRRASGKARSAGRGTAVAALRQQLRTIAARLGTPAGRHVTNLIAASDAEGELPKVFRNHFVLARRSEGRALLQQAVRAGEVRRDLDLEVALDSIYGPLFFRLLMGHAPLDARFTDRLLRHVLRGLAS
jgi:AcrR family transcriptional regulator